MEQTKQNIIDCALDLIRKRGIKFRIDDIVAELGISKKTVYKHFQTKEEIVDAVFFCLAETTEDKFGEIIEGKQSHINKIKDLLMLLPNLYTVTDKKVSDRLGIKAASIAKFIKLSREIKALTMLYLDESIKKGVLLDVNKDHFLIVFEAVFEKTLYNPERQQIADLMLEVALRGLQKDII